MSAITARRALAAAARQVVNLSAPGATEYQALADAFADVLSADSGCETRIEIVVGASPHAHLTATAPEMLTFLRRLATAGDWYISALEFRSLADFDGEALERELLALIAKAEGRAP